MQLLSFMMLPLLWLVLIVAPITSVAISGTSQVAWEGKAVEPRKGWPEGALKLINSPFRCEGWNPWFSGTPSDIDYFEMRVQNTDDVNQLITRLSEIKAPKLIVCLDPRKQAGYLGFSTRINEEKHIAATFELGDQERLDHWYRYQSQATKQELGRSLDERAQPIANDRPSPQPAAPPQLTLYVGNDLIKLEELRVPQNVSVISCVTSSYLEEHRDDPAIGRINEFVGEIERRRTQINFNYPELSQSDRIALVKEAQEAYRSFVRAQAINRGTNIPQQFWGKTMKSLKPLRVVDDKVNIKIVLLSTGDTEAGFYVQQSISSFVRPRSDFLEFIPLTQGEESLFGNLYRFSARLEKH